MTTESIFGTFPEMFRDFLENSLQQNPEIGTELHKPSFESFLKLGFPTRKNEEWKYTNVKSLSQTAFEHAPDVTGDVDASLYEALLSPNETNLVFVDGHLSAALSNLTALQKGLVIKDLKTAYREDGNKVLSMIGAGNDEKFGGHSAFRNLNAAFFDSGIFIEVEAGVRVEKPVHILHVCSGQAKSSAALFPRIMILAQKSSELDLIESYVGQGEYLVSTELNGAVAENASVKHLRIQNDSPEAYHIGQNFVSVSDDARFNSMNICLGSKLHRIDMDCRLAGKNGELTLNGFYYADGKRHVDNHSRIDHALPQSISLQLYKGIITDEARAVFNGKVFVSKDAQQTCAFQLNKNLLLSNEAEIDTKPELQIDADDVKCSHGATVGQLNPDEIFYLESRGIRKTEAVKLLAKAFADEVLGHSPLKGMDDRLHQLVHSKLSF